MARDERRKEDQFFREPTKRGVRNSGSNFLSIAHRGASGRAPENTLAAFAEAARLGAHAVEFDVWVVEGKVVVHHDLLLDRTTDGAGRITGTTLSALRSLDAGGGERVPFLEEVLDLLAGKLLVNVELRGPGVAGPVIEVLDGFVGAGVYGPESFVISSFDHPALLTARDLAPLYPRGLLTEGVPISLPDLAAAVGATSYHASRDYLTDGAVAGARDAGLDVFVWTVNEEDEMRLLREKGVQGVFTDFPERALRADADESTGS